jgi:hypothetical protein
MVIALRYVVALPGSMSMTITCRSPFLGSQLLQLRRQALTRLQLLLPLLAAPVLAPALILQQRLLLPQVAVLRLALQLLRRLQQAFQVLLLALAPALAPAPALVLTRQQQLAQVVQAVRQVQLRLLRQDHINRVQLIVSGRGMVARQKLQTFEPSAAVPSQLIL